MAQDHPSEVSYDKARTLYQENRYAQAKKVLLENISRFPDHAPSHLLLGQIHFFSRKPDYEAARDEFGKVIGLLPSSIEGHNWLGSAFLKLGDINAAIGSYRKAIRLSPEDSRPHVSLGYCFILNGRYSEAIKMLRRGLELKPYCTEADVRMWLGEALEKNNQLSDACDEWRRVVEIEPGWPSYDAPQKNTKKMLAKHCGNS